MQSTRTGVFFGGDAAWGPQNIIWAVEHGHQAAISIHNHCQGRAVTDRPPDGMNLVSAKLGMNGWSYHNDYNPSPRAKMTHEELVKRFSAVSVEVELGFTPEQTAREVAALPQLRHRDALHRQAVHRVRRVRGHLPRELPHHRARTGTRPTSARGSRHRRRTSSQDVYVSSRAAADQARDGEGRGPVPALRTLRGEMSDRSVGYEEVRAGDSLRFRNDGRPKIKDESNRARRRQLRMSASSIFIFIFDQ